MTVEKGADWGETGPLAPDGVIVGSDTAARLEVTKARRAGRPVPELGLTGGDLWRTCGGPGGGESRLRSPDAQRLPVDLGSVLIDGALHWFTAHLVARRSWWRGPIFAAMNAPYLGKWDVAPRGHPNDGLLDVFEVTMTTGDRWKARSRLVTGTHVPHPRIHQSRVSAVQFDLPPRTTVWLDGEAVATSARTLSIRLEADALVCVV